MARSRIPYTDLETELKKMLKAPIYVRVKLLRPDRYNDLKAPPTIYDRSTGNYARIGYYCDVAYDEFVGFGENFEGRFQSIYKSQEDKMFIPYSLN